MSLWLPCGLHGFAVPNTVTVTVRGTLAHKALTSQNNGHMLDNSSAAVLLKRKQHNNRQYLHESIMDGCDCHPRYSAHQQQTQQDHCSNMFNTITTPSTRGHALPKEPPL
jgi:hypothetical protein